MEKNIKIGKKIYTVASDDNYLEAMGDDFEPHMVQLFSALIEPQDVVADIGANIGLTAILFSNLGRKVYAFEPSASTYQILKENLARAVTANVEAVNVGMGNKAESLTITFAKNNRSGGYVSDKIRPESGHVTETIQIDTLDHFFSNAEIAPSFLKIDVEGFEQNVIKGGGVFLREHKPTVVMEMNHFCLDVLQRITIPDFLDYMRSVFPFLYAIDTDNATIVDLHVPDKAYFVMHEHVVRQRFPNIVGGFTPEVKSKLDVLGSQATLVAPLVDRMQTAVRAVMAKLVQGKLFDTPAIMTAPGAIFAKWVPQTMSPGQEVEIAVIVTNKSNDEWYGYGSHPVLFSYHWLNADGSIYLNDGLRTPMTCEALQPSKQADGVVNVLAPGIKGQYQLVLTLVQEGVCWFEDKGFSPIKFEVLVR